MTAPETPIARLPHVMLEARPLTDDERGLLNHVCMWGSDGYPIRKVGRRHWGIEFRSVRWPVLFKTKREALAAWDKLYTMLLDLDAAAAYRRAIAERAARIGAP